MRTKEKVLALVVSAVILLQLLIIVSVLKLASIYSNPFLRCWICNWCLNCVHDGRDTEKPVCKELSAYFSGNRILKILMIVGVTIAVRHHISVGNYMLYSWICLPILLLMLLALTTIEIQ